MIRTLADTLLIRSPLTNAPYSPHRAGEFLLPRATLAVVDTFARLGTPVEWLLGVIERRGKRRSAIQELSALDDRILSDIGIGRSEIPAAVDAALDKESRTNLRVNGKWQR